MADPTTAFFERLAERATDPSLGQVTGTVRIDLDRDGRSEHWRVALRRGSIVVSRSADAADCVLRATGAVFDDLASGRANALAATLRNELDIEGDPNLLVRFQRLLPAPTGARRTTSDRVIGKRRG
jgi:SCP-2 sterol transfer family